jgi:NADP-dependent 3-hydroxy acid dehydrogenase YdfG
MPKANEHVVVVGGTSGIGLSLVRAAHALGCKLTLTGRGAERTAETAKSVGPDVVGCHLDLDDAGSIAAALKEGPSIDHLVLLPLYQVATTVKDFNVGEANKLLHIKITGYIKAVSTVLPRLKPDIVYCAFWRLSQGAPLSDVDDGHGSQRRYCGRNEDSRG